MEETPHIHVLICPRFEDKQGVKVLSNERYFGGKAKLIEWQNKYADAMKEFELKRGVQYSKCDHRDIKNFYAYVDRAEEIENANEIDPKFLLTQNVMLKSRVNGLEETLENYRKQLRLEKAAHQKDKEEKEKNIDYGFMLNICLDYLEEKEHINKQEISKLVELAAAKGNKLKLEKENERGIEYER